MKSEELADAIWESMCKEVVEFIEQESITGLARREGLKWLTKNS